MQSADSGRSLFGALDYAPEIKTYYGQIDINPTLEKLDKKVIETDKLISGLPKPKALVGADSFNRDNEFNKDLSVIEEVSKNPNLYEAHKNVIKGANEYVNKVKAGSHGAREKSLLEFEDRAKRYDQMLDKEVNSDEASLRLAIDLAKHNQTGGTAPNKVGGYDTFARKNPDLLVPSTSTIDFTKQLDLEDVGYKSGNYIDPNSSKLSPAVRGVFDQMYQEVSSQGVTPQRAMKYSETIFDSSPKIKKAVEQRAVTDIAKQLQSNGLSEEQVAEIIAKNELSGGNTEIQTLINQRAEQLRNQYISAGTQHLYKSLGGVEYKGSFDPSYISSLKGASQQELNAPITPTAATANPQAIDELDNIDISNDGKITTHTYYKNENGKQVPTTKEEYAQKLGQDIIIGGMTRGLVSGNTYQKNKEEIQVDNLYKNNPAFKNIVDGSVEVDKIEGNVDSNWKPGPKYMEGTLKNYKEAIKNYKNIFIDERLNSAKKQKYKTTIDQATLSGRTFIEISTANKTGEESAMNIEQLIKKHGPIEKVTSSGSATSNPYNLFPLSDNLEVKFKDSETPIKFITNLPNEEAQQAAVPLQNFMNHIYSAKSGEVDLPALGKVKINVSYRDKTPKFLVTDNKGHVFTPKQVEKWYHNNVIFPQLKSTELSYYGSEDKTDPNSNEVAE